MDYEINEKESRIVDMGAWTILTFVSFYGLIANLFIGSQVVEYVADPVKTESNSGWVRLDKNKSIRGGDKGLLFASASRDSAFIDEGGFALKLKGEVNIRHTFFNFLYWLPWVEHLKSWVD